MQPLFSKKNSNFITKVAVTLSAIASAVMVPTVASAQFPESVGQPNLAVYRLVNGRERVHQYTLRSLTRNQHGVILGVNWDNGIRSTYYLGRSGDLLIDDGTNGTWAYNPRENLLVLTVFSVGTFVFNMNDDCYSARYYWDAPADGCRDIITGQFVSGHWCR